jgi:hypothetical protein
MAEQKHTPETFTLSNGRQVLAKAPGQPYHFSNRTQAERKAAEVGGNVCKFGRPFYVVLHKTEGK